MSKYNNDVIFSIFRFLPIQTFTDVCLSHRSLPEIASTELLWQEKTRSIFKGYHTVSGLTWKNLFITLSRSRTYLTGTDEFGIFVEDSVFRNFTELGIYPKCIGMSRTSIVFTDIYDVLHIISSETNGMKNLKIKAKAVSCGASHTIFIDMNDDVYVFGSNQRGQLGTGDYTPRNIPYKIPNIKAKKVKACFSTTFIIDQEDNLWGFGWNIYFQLGIKEKQLVNTPTKLSLKAKDVSGGEMFTVVLGLDGKLYGSGNNNMGQFPYKKPGSFVGFFKIKGLRNWKFVKIECGDHHTLALTDKKRLVGFGLNRSGQASLSSSEIPVYIMMENVKDFSGGSFHSVIITDNGTILCSGRGDHYQLTNQRTGHINALHKIKSVKGEKVVCTKDLTLVVGYKICEKIPW